jgi:hypothetical protein
VWKEHSEPAGIEALKDAMAAVVQKCQERELSEAVGENL